MRLTLWGLRRRSEDPTGSLLVFLGDSGPELCFVATVTSPCKVPVNVSV